MHPKDVVLVKHKPNVVYRIPCASCLATYVHQTKRRLEKRINEHRTAVQKAEIETSTLAEHAWKSDYGVNGGK